MTSVAYNTSKAAVLNFTRALAGEWGVHGINVNALAPGFFPSKMTAGLLAHVGVDNMRAHVPLRRLGDDEDLKGAALLLASDAGKHITGQLIAVDGGVSAVHGGLKSMPPHPVAVRAGHPVRAGAGHAALALRFGRRRDQPGRAPRNAELVAGGARRRGMTLLDVVMAHAARSVRDAQEHGTPGIVTLEMKTSFMRPATGRLVAWGHLLHGTRGTAFCEGSVRDAQRRAVRPRHRHLQVPAQVEARRRARRLPEALPRAAARVDPTPQGDSTMSTINRQILLASRPTASPSPRTSSSSRRPSRRWPTARCWCATTS